MAFTSRKASSLDTIKTSARSSLQTRRQHSCTDHDHQVPSPSPDTTQFRPILSNAYHGKLLLPPERGYGRTQHNQSLHSISPPGTRPYHNLQDQSRVTGSTGTFIPSQAGDGSHRESDTCSSNAAADWFLLALTPYPTLEPRQQHPRSH